MIPIKDFYENKNKTSYKDYGVAQQNPRSSRQLLIENNILHQMEREQVTGFQYQGMMSLFNILSPLIYP